MKLDKEKLRKIGKDLIGEEAEEGTKKWVKTTEHAGFTQWTLMWYEDGEECLGPAVTVRWKHGVWNMYADDSLDFKLPVTEHFKTEEEALKSAHKFMKKYPKGW